MVIMARGIARGRVRTTTTKSRNMAAIVQQLGLRETHTLGLFRTSLILDIHFMVNYHYHYHYYYSEENILIYICLQK